MHPGKTVSTPAPAMTARERVDVVEPEVSSTPTPAALAATPTPKEAPVVYYASIGLVVVGLLALALRRRE